MTSEERTPQEDVVAQAPGVEVSEETQQRIDDYVDAYKARLLDMTEQFRHRQMVEIEAAGGPNLAGGYQYWNCLTAGPLQTYLDPPYRPSKIIAAGETCTLIGVIWINPANGPGGSLPGTVVLGGRPWRARFEGMNLSTVANGPDFTFGGVFPSPAPVVTPLVWNFVAPDPGINPNLYEMNFTLDVTLGGQPFAAFSTWHFDPDTEPGFLLPPGIQNVPGGPVPTQFPHWQFERPARFLVYRE